MKNKILINGNEIIRKYKDDKNKKYTYYKLGNGSSITAGELNGSEILIQCHQCNSWKQVNFYNGLLYKIYYCQSCGKIGKKNPFYGKKHSEELKQKFREERVCWTGEKNPFYGKTHSKETRLKLSKKLTGLMIGEKNPFYGKSHSEKTRQRLSLTSRKFYEKNPEHFATMTKNSLERQKNGFKSSIEKIMESELARRKINNKYSKILGKYQYDFLLPDFNILLEVQGDYWHANPDIYGLNGRSLNKTQKYKVDQDAKKLAFAQKLGFNVLYIWESEINQRQFSVLDSLNEI